MACTEMISARAIFYNSIQTLEMLRTCDRDNPLVVQLFGSDVLSLEEAVKFLKDMGFIFFDLNAGCPMKKVTRTGAGAALLREPSLLLRIAEAMVRVAGEGRVGVKMRLGWDSKNPVFLEVAEKLEGVGVSWVTLHPRFAKEKFSGRARWECLKKLKERIRIPVIASGDLFTPEDALRCVKVSRVDGVMFARGALKSPPIFRDYLSILEVGMLEKTLSHVMEERIGMIKRHVQLIEEIYGHQKRLVYNLRGILARYIRGFPFSKALREKAVRLDSWDEVKEFVNKMEEISYVQRSDKG